ncbi:hypothetical protein JCM33374_g31 [Metschnikowia sp. JCM 33374]|nr:hypothetical protein JCM33374_g31 [Metschnikowia sp. JCM 33374]
MGEFLPRLAKAPRISNKWQLDLGIHVSRKAFRATEEKPEEASVSEKPKKLSFLWIILLIVPKTLSLLYSAFRYFFGLNLTAGIYDQPRARFDYDSYDETFDASKSILTEETANSYNITCEKFNECHESSQRDFHFLWWFCVMIKNTGDFKETQLFLNNVEKSPEAFEVATTYNRRRIPYIFLVGNVTRDPSIMSSMSLIYKANCALGDEEEQEVLMQKVVRNLRRTLNDYNPQLITKRFDKQEIEMSRLLKEKQDEAYLESLHSDKVKKVEKENQRKQEELQKKLSILRKGFIKYLANTKHFETQVEGISTSESIRISIKLPDGRRIVQKFPKTAAMGEIYLFVETQLFEDESEVEGAEMSVVEFLDQFSFSFELFKPLPKCSLPSSKDTIADFENLKSGDSVLFEYNDSEDNDTV